MAEADVNKRSHLQNRAMTYMERAEEIKRSITQSYALQRQLSQSSNSGEASGTTEENSGTSSNSNVDAEEVCIAKSVSKVTLENRGGDKPVSQITPKSNPVISAITPKSGFKHLRKLWQHLKFESEIWNSFR